MKQAGKIAITIFIFIVVIVAGVIYLQQKPKNETPPPYSGALCFSYNKAATTIEPYTVSEKVKFIFGEKSVSGSKFGSQRGPDMTNSYAGTLSGSRDGQTITVSYSYIIEGSSQTEEEEYIVTKDGLVKMRYPLIETDNGTLVPDKTKEAKEIPYTAISCNELDTLEQTSTEENKPVETAPITLGESVSVYGLKITPLEVVEDSRCPAKVQCIQAGTVQLKLLIEEKDWTTEQIVTLGEALKKENKTITLINVTPYPTAPGSITKEKYQFTFLVESK